jgi:ketosteroid isomerase-like protein
VVAVVAYVGKDAPQVMPLRSGDVLVCDATDPAVKGRLTSVAALRTYRRRGVELFSVECLHAKVIASPTAAWVGSANASDNSESQLVEAAVRVTKDQAKDLYRWAVSLATEDCEVHAAELKRLAGLKLSPPRPGPRRTVPPQTLPPTVKRLLIWRLDGEITKAQQAAVDRDRPAARRAARTAGLPSGLDPVPFIGDTVIKTGDWLLTIRNGRVQAPGFVVRLTRENRGGRLWLSRVSTRRKPPISLLRSLVPELETPFEEIVVRKPTATGAILDIFR